MARKNQIRQHTALRTTLRLTLIAATAAVAGLMVLLIVVFNITQDQIGHAQSSMAFKGAEIIQDSSNVLRGSINQRVVGVIVETSGKGNPCKMNAIVFNARGTSEPVQQNIENARLWYTSGENTFLPTQQVGTTVTKIDEKNFEFTCNTVLQAGKNYFWLTYDVKPDAATGPGTIDAVCEDIRIGAISYRPIISNPLGKRFTDPNIPYFSMGNFAVNNLGAWNSKRDGSGVTPKQLNATRNSYFIQAGHKMISSTGSSLQTLVVENGGALRITAPLRLNTMYVACGGTVQMDVAVEDYYCFNTFHMQNGGNYIHNNTGYLPGLHCDFDERSNQTFFQYSQGTFPYNISWGNVMIDATTPLNLDIQRYFQNVKGDLEIRKTGLSDNGLFSGGSDTMRIGGSFIMSGGNFSGISGKESTLLLIEVGQNLVMKNGAFTDADRLKNNGKTILRIKGDVMLLGGTFKFDQAKGSLLTFDQDGVTRWIQKSTCTVTLGDVNICNGHDVIIKGEKMGDLASGNNIVVGSGGRLFCGMFPVSGMGKFFLNDNATLGIGHPDGIYSTGEKGNIQTSSRQFDSGANYCYYTGSQPQQTGVFTTTPEVNTVRRLILDKDRSSQVLSLSQDLNIRDKVSINKGDIKESGFELKLPRMSSSSQ
ncbi:hypothetical protein BH11BAC2_BH11BAC2_05960 [soil metagenome]